jgi:nicotinamidase-related amidase
MRTELFIIDPQVDFCNAISGALYVNGAEADMTRLAHMIRRLGSRIDGIHVTLDTHHYVHIAHPIFWKNPAGEHPAPFTIITKADVDEGKWVATEPRYRQNAVAYVNALETNGRYNLCIWPYHCLIGSPGHAVIPELYDALVDWEKRFAVVNYVAKGSNLLTEHYSAIQAEVPDPADASTLVNRDLIDSLFQADLVAIAGEAGSHCVANTVRDLVKEFGHDSHLDRLILLTDAMSPVSGFEPLQDEFIREMVDRGMQLSTTTDFLKR